MSLFGAILESNNTYLYYHDTLILAGHAVLGVNTRSFQSGGTQLKLMLKIHYLQY